MSSLPSEMNEHYGQNTRGMPKLLKAGESPIHVAGIMKARLSQGDEFSDLWNKWYDTSDLVVYPKGNDKEVYVFLTVDNQGQITNNGRKALELIKNSNLASNRGAIVKRLRDLGRKGLKGLIKVPRGKVKTDTYLTQQQILDQQVWRILARDPSEVPKDFAEDGSLLRAYASEVQKRTGSKDNMALYIGDSLSDKTTLKAWYVGRLEDWSDARGRSSLVGDFGRLVGLAPEALGALGKRNLVEKVSPVETFSVAQILEESCNTSDYAPNQIKRFQNILDQRGYEIRKK